MTPPGRVRMRSRRLKTNTSGMTSIESEVFVVITNYFHVVSPHAIVHTGSLHTIMPILKAWEPTDIAAGFDGISMMLDHL